MRRCGACGKWVFGKERICPNCQADLWEAEASKKLSRPFMLMEDAENLFLKGEEEKAGVFALAAMNAILEGERKPSFDRMQEAVDILSDMYSEAESIVPDELMSDALDYLEDLAQARGNEEDVEEVNALRERVVGVVPDFSRQVKEGLLPYQDGGWRLPLPETVMRFRDDAAFAPDLTRTKGLSMMETGYMFYQSQAQGVSIIRRGGTKQELMAAVFSANGLSPEYAGPVADVFVSLLQGIQAAGANAYRMMSKEPKNAGNVRLLQTACSAAAQEIGLFPEELFFLALAAPFLEYEGSLNETVYAAMEPGLRRILQIMEDSKREGKDQEETNYKRQLLQTLATEYCNLYAVMEHLAAAAHKPQNLTYQRYLESAAGNGLSLACAEAARNLFFGENGYETDMEAAKFYTVILKMRGILYHIVKSVDQIRDLRVKIPGMDE
ncbi:MAG: hypothetical protein IKN57_03705 [Parasporobacterium sp.]|nr:hypothetical protein [Parasporobacterium sp.]